MPPFLYTAPTEYMSTLRHTGPSAFRCHAARGETERTLACGVAESGGGQGCCRFRLFPWFVVDGDGGGVVDFVG